MGSRQVIGAIRPDLKVFLKYFRPVPNLPGMSAFSAVASVSARPATPSFGVLPAPAVRDAILLIEDDDMVGMLIAQVLERTHWRVLRASDGAASERLMVEHGPAIALALVDCGLPDMEGGGLCERLRAAQPGLPLLLTSGREYSELAQRLRTDGPAIFLAKPFMPLDVVGRVQTLLGQAA